jgi:hypothetical protein
MESATLLAGRYELGEPIGEGASAVVHRGWDHQANGPVAIKILRPHLGGDAVSILRFRRELHITRALEHPRVVTVHELVQEGDRLCLVMKLAEGQSLDRRIAIDGRLPVGEAVAILRQVLEILAACHRKHVLHRDLKPQNIIVGPDGIVELLDFGVACLTDGGALTQTGATVGSPEFMAPELFEQHRSDRRTDLYAVGVIAFALLAGDPPFSGDSLAELHSQHAAAPVPALGKLRGDVPAWLQHFVERLLAKRSFERYQSADEAIADLEARRVVARELPRSARRLCLQCGEEVAADLPICVRCGADRTAPAGQGDRNVYCAPDTDERRLGDFLEATVGVRPRRRGRRTLVLSLVDPWVGEVMARRARDFGIVLTSVPRPTLLGVRKVAWLALAAYFAIATFNYFSRKLTYYGRYYFDQLDAIQLLQLTLSAAVVWVALRRALALEDRPLARPQASPNACAGAEIEWLRRLRPLLGRDRPEPLATLVGAMLEAYFKLVRSGARIERGVRSALQRAVESAAALANALGAIHRRLDEDALARAEELRALARASELAGAGPSDLRRRAALTEQVEEHHRLEESAVALTDDLVAVQATFNRLCGRALVLRTPIDDADRQALDGHVAALARDAQVAREVQAALERRL